MKKKIGILTPSFYDGEGEKVYNGGGERYLIDLVSIFKELGFDCEIFQLADKKWQRNYNGLKINGLSCKAENDFQPDLNRQFNKITSHYWGQVFFTHYLSYPQAKKRSIGISHGVWWDLTLSNGKRCEWRQSEEWWNRLENSFKLPQKTISVDTNTINLLRAFWPALSEDRFEFIPNYVDLEKFKISNNKPPQPFTVLYPRRLCYERGFDIAIKVAENLTKGREKIRFLFVGSGGEQEENYLKNCNETIKDIEWFSLKAENMPEAYSLADIVILPTVGAEGTSLSCLEAMACGVPVIATSVGGMSDIIRDGYNGLFCEPSPESLEEKTLQLFNSKDLREKLSKNALKAVQYFSKYRWVEAWKKVIREVF